MIRRMNSSPFGSLTGESSAGYHVTGSTTGSGDTHDGDAENGGE